MLLNISIINVISFVKFFIECIVFDIIHLISMKSSSLCFLFLLYKNVRIYKKNIGFIRIAHNPTYS